MKAAYIEQVGPPENIQYGEILVPQPKASECLVRVEAVSVNPIDTYLRAGTVPMKLPMPYVVGCDLAGTVEAVGEKVKLFKPGDRVWGSNQGLMGRQGSFAEYAAVDERWLYALPQEVSIRDAAAMALVGITAHLGLFRHAKLRKNETVFVSGGSGGVGSCVVQMGKAIGARVITCAGTDEKVERVRQLGADVVINYQTQDVDQALTESAPKGVNLWWEVQREPDFDRILRHLALRGRIVVMAGREARPPFPIGPFYTRDCAMYGFAMFNSTASQQRRAGEEISRWLAEGKLRANIGRVMKLSETAEAHRLQEEKTLHKQGTLAGKIVLEP